jgi:two-component system chemotaxis response regulator CheY
MGSVDQHPVLVIEDDDSACEALVEAFSIEKIDAVGASDAITAIDRFHGGLRPCAIVLDLGLPLMAGEEFLKARRFDAELARIPVVVVTGRDVSKANFPDSNVVAVFQKPFDPWKIIEVLRPFCEVP